MDLVLTAQRQRQRQLVTLQQPLRALSTAALCPTKELEQTRAMSSSDEDFDLSDEEMSDPGACE